MLELVETTDCGLVAVLKRDTHGSTWIKELKKFYHDPTVTERIQPLIQPDWVCVDVGANIGTFARAMAERLVTGNVLAFEPNVFAFAALLYNVHRFPVVIADHFALSDCRAHKYLAVEANAGAASIMEGVSGNPFPQCCYTFPMDELCLKRLDFMKIDVEGYEPHVLAGAIETIKRCRPLIFCEVNRGALSRYGFTHEDIVKPLLTLGYGIEYLDDGHSFEMEQVDVFFKPNALA